MEEAGHDADPVVVWLIWALSALVIVCGNAEPLFPAVPPGGVRTRMAKARQTLEEARHDVRTRRRFRREIDSVTKLPSGDGKEHEAGLAAPSVIEPDEPAHLAAFESFRPQYAAPPAHPDSGAAPDFPPAHAWFPVWDSSAGSVDDSLVRAVIQAESAFDPLALSPKGAMGLMQLMPETARMLGVEDPFHAEENVRGGTEYLGYLLSRYGGSVPLALAAYNAGPGAVDEYRGIPPFTETQNYVSRVLRYYLANNQQPLTRQ